MWECAICHFDCLADDIAIAGVNHCICLRCYGRVTESGKPMSRPLEKAIRDMLAQHPH